jgi:hypothetical protein
MVLLIYLSDMVKERPNAVKEYLDYPNPLTAEPLAKVGNLGSRRL